MENCLFDEFGGSAGWKQAEEGDVQLIPITRAITRLRQLCLKFHTKWLKCDGSSVVQQLHAGGNDSVDFLASILAERSEAMARFIIPLALGLALALSAFGQSSPDQNTTTDQTHEQKGQPGAVREIGAGAGTAGVGAAKGAGDLAKGGGKAVVDAVTLHPINAAGAAGKGAASAGKDVSVGAVKGTGKVAKGVGRLFKKIL